MPANTTADKAHPSRQATRVRLDLFDSRKNLDRGSRRTVEIAWYLVKCIVFLSPLPWPVRTKVFLLRCFGAQIGKGVIIKPRANIHLPWKLVIGDHSWIGEEVFILNFETVTIGDHACISQRAFLCTGNHDYRDETFGYRNAPIAVGQGAWIGAQSFIGPGVTIGVDTVVTAGSIVTKALPDAMVCSGNPCAAVKPRWKQQQDSRHES